MGGRAVRPRPTRCKTRGIEIVNEKDWILCLEKLITETKQSIDKFSAEHKDEEISYINYDTDPIYGYVLISYNTLEYSKEYARTQHDYRVSYIREWIEKSSWQKSALENIKRKSISPHCDSSGDFKYMGCLLYTSPSPRDATLSRMPSSA